MDSPAAHPADGVRHVSAPDLVSWADDIMRDAGDLIPLLCTDGVAWSQVIDSKIHDDPYGVAVHHSSLTEAFASCSLTRGEQNDLRERYVDQDTRSGHERKVAWPMRLKLAGGKYRKAERPEPASIAWVASEDPMTPSSLTVTALPARDDQGGVWVGWQHLSARPATVREQRSDAAGAREADRERTAPPEDVARPVNAAWQRLTPGSDARCEVRGAAMRLVMSPDRTVRVYWAGKSWRTRTPDAIARRISD